MTTIFVQSVPTVNVVNVVVRQYTLITSSPLNVVI